MGIRKYSSTASEKTISENLGIADDVLNLEDVENLPTIAEGSGDVFTMVLSPDTTDEEIVTVTSRTGTQLTIIRAEEGTGPAKSHPAGRKARHMITARDLQNAENHYASSAAHNVSEVVGRTESQVLTGKTISGANNTLTNIAQSSVVSLVSDLDAKASNTSLNTHTGASTSVHGIADTSRLARVASASAGRTIFVQSAQPTANAVGDIWFQVTGL